MHPHRAKAKAMHSAKVKKYADGGAVDNEDSSIASGPETFTSMIAGDPSRDKRTRAALTVKHNMEGAVKKIHDVDAAMGEKRGGRVQR